MRCGAIQFLTRSRSPIAVALVAVTLAGCDEYPRDPNGTLERVTGGTMLVGLLSHEPWVRLDGATPEGVEVALVRGLAEQLDAEVEWVTVREADVLDALKRHELDLVIGGLTSSNPWKSHVAFTRTYYEEDLVVAAGRPLVLDDLEGLEIEVTLGSAEAALVAEHGGTPMPVAAAAELEAKPEWQLEPSESAVFELHTDRHVFAVPQGENAWLIAVERYLSGRKDEVGTALAASR